MTTPAQPTSFTLVEAAAVRAMSRELERAERLAAILRWRRYVRLEHFTAADRALLRRHRAVQRALRALAREHHARVLVARRAEEECPACR